MAGCVPTHITFQINRLGAECMRVPMEESGSQIYPASGSPGGLVKPQITLLPPLELPDL